MIRTSGLSSFPLLCVLLCAAPSGATPPAQTPGEKHSDAPARLSKEGSLVISRQTSGTVEGRFSNSDVTDLAFRTVNEGSRGEVVLTARGGRELMRASQDGDLVILSVYGGEARTVVDMSIVRESARQGALPEKQRTPFPVERGVREEGDLQAFERFTLSAEARALPWLSRALGARGFTGRNAPSVLPLHRLALRIADDTQEFPSELEAAADTPIVLDVCLDLRPDPHGDDCLGMCGPGRSCWSWVCGDCCCHDGCRNHDSVCRRCRWYRPFSCLLCITGVPFLIGACDTSCQARDFAESRVIYTGEICGGATPDEDAKCAGLHDGATEACVTPPQWQCLPAEPGLHRCQVFDPCRNLSGCAYTRCRQEESCNWQFACDDAGRSACYAQASCEYDNCSCPLCDQQLCSFMMN